MSSVAFRALSPFEIDVDKFCSTSKIGFLSHLHSDHCIGLNVMLENHGNTLYCSEGTKRLVLKRFPKSNPDSIITIEPHEHLMIKTTGVEVLPFTANHCFGSLMFLFITPKHERILYTGDFRFEFSDFSTDHVKEMFSLMGKVHKMYIDTTFAHNFYSDIPSRNSSIDTMIKLITNSSKKKVVISLDVLGSETILMSLGHRLNVKFHLDENVKATRRIELESLCGDHLTNDKQSKYQVTLKENLKKLSDEENLLILPSTLWSKIEWEQSMGMKKIQEWKKVENYHYVMYSMHSSLDEIRMFVDLVKPKKIYSILEGNFDAGILLSKKRSLNVQDVSPKDRKTESYSIPIIRDLSNEDLLDSLE